MNGISPRLFYCNKTACDLTFQVIISIKFCRVAGGGIGVVAVVVVVVSSDG